jgi:hypothetical protein
MTDDIRWLQRFANYTRALQSLSDAVALAGKRPLSKLEQLGLIQAPAFAALQQRLAPLTQTGPAP